MARRVARPRHHLRPNVVGETLLQAANRRQEKDFLAARDGDVEEPALLPLVGRLLVRRPPILHAGDEPLHAPSHDDDLAGQAL